jgi:hypothetical protein
LDTTGAGLVGEPTPARVESRHEIYLRLYDLDLEDPQQILEFANSYGALQPALMPELPRPAGVSSQYSRAREQAEIKRIVASDTAVHRALDPDQPDWPQSFEPLQIVPLTSFRFAARCLRDLTAAWRLLSDQSDSRRTHWEAHPAIEANTSAAYLLLTGGLTPLLNRISPYVLPASDEDSSEEPPPERGNDRRPTTLRQSRALPHPLLHEFCALELYNHIAGQELYRTCRNANCGRSFVRQYGRAEHGQSRRQGVLYCSHACAQATAQRDYRRRKRARLHQLADEPQ